MIDSIASHILALPIWVALLLVFALPALESSAFVGFLFPGEIALVLGGVLASEGKVSLTAVLAAGISGAIVGDSLGYAIGRRYGRGMLEGTLGRFINHKHFDRAERYLVDRGGRAVFLGRFTAALRVMMPGLAGMSRMHYARFAAYNVAGGVAWGAMVVVLGYLGGNSWRQVAHLASRIGLGALVAVVLGFAFAYLVRRTRRAWAQRALDRLRSSRIVVRIRQRFPRQCSWLATRFDPSTSRGLALTTASAILVGSVWIFLGITQDVVSHDGIALLDPAVHTWVLAHRTPWLDVLMRTVTWLGSSAVLAPLLAVAALTLRGVRHSWRTARALAGVYAITVLVHAVVAELVNRQRPPSADWLAAAGGWSYPSGHTMQATAGWGVLAVLLATGSSTRVKVRLLGAATAVFVVVAASRVYLGMHWLSDVLGAITLTVSLLSIWAITWLSGSSSSAGRTPKRLRTTPSEGSGSDAIRSRSGTASVTRTPPRAGSHSWSAPPAP